MLCDVFVEESLPWIFNNALRYYSTQYWDWLFLVSRHDDCSI